MVLGVQIHDHSQIVSSFLSDFVVYVREGERKRFSELCKSLTGLSSEEFISAPSKTPSLDSGESNLEIAPSQSKFAASTKSISSVFSPVLIMPLIQALASICQNNKWDFSGHHYSLVVGPNWQTKDSYLWINVNYILNLTTDH